MRVIFCHDRRDALSSFVRTGGFGTALLAAGVETGILVPLDAEETMPQIKLPDSVLKLPSLEPRVDRNDRVDNMAERIAQGVQFLDGDVLVGYCYAHWMPHLVLALRKKGISITHVQTVEDEAESHLRAAIRCFPTVDLYMVLNDSIGRAIGDEMRELNPLRPGVSVVPQGIPSIKAEYIERETPPPLHLCFYGDLVHEDTRVLDLGTIAVHLAAEGIDFVFHVFGTGKDEKALRTRLDHHKLTDHFVFEGDVRLTDMSERWGEFHAIIRPQANAGFPSALIYAMAHGTLPIAARTADIDTIIIPNSNGYVFPAGEPKDAATLVKRILNDPVAYRRIARKAHTTTQNDLTIDARLDTFLKAIQGVKDTRDGEHTREPQSLMVPSVLDNPFMPRSITRFAKTFSRRFRNDE
jgi:glycosyltransferase involved in cell wall biosynthesis